VKTEGLASISLTLAVVLSSVPVVARPNAAAISYQAELSNPQELGKLSDSIRRQMERKTEDEWIRVIIRLDELADLSGIGREKAVDAMKAHARGTKSRC
jgi:molybdopterin biosynthesis enzyme